MNLISKRKGLAILCVPLSIALTGVLLSSSLRFEYLAGQDGWGYVVPGLGLVLSLACVGLLVGGRIRIARYLILAYLILVAADLAMGVAALVMQLTSYEAGEGGLRLLANSSLLWIYNVQVFSMAYWTLDAQLWSSTGAQARRHFFFPQQTQVMQGYETWEPSLFSYVYLSLTVSTTYGPSDMPAASDTAKALVMVQSLIALALFTLTIARAVGIMG